jgi:hypothetical protein
MKNTKHFFGLVFVPFLPSVFLLATSISHANTRSISFLGQASSAYSMIELHNLSRLAACQITVMNISNQNQNIDSISLWGFNPTTQKMVQTKYVKDGTKPILWTHVRIDESGSSSDDCLKSTVPLKPGAICHFRISTFSFRMSEATHLCGGTITVRDTDPKAQGSVIAAGSIATIQETKVIGGALSGAHYLSGPLFTQGPTVAPVQLNVWRDSNSLPNQHDLGGNMNVYCAQACKTFTGAEQYSSDDKICENFCGNQPQGFYNTEGNFALDKHKRGFQLSGVSSKNKFTGDPPTDNYTLLASSRFAGGYVQEIQMGAFTSICSGNTGFVANGGLDHMHWDSPGIDRLAVAGNYSSTTFPPERLVCNHRHAQDDLYSKTGQSVTFTINSGMPF